MSPTETNLRNGKHIRWNRGTRDFTPTDANGSVRANCKPDSAPRHAKSSTKGTDDARNGLKNVRSTTDSSKADQKKMSGQKTDAEERKAQRLKKKLEREPFIYRNQLSPAEMLKQGLACITQRNFIIICIDLEMYEFDTNKITEIGIAVLECDPENSFFMPNIICHHLVPAEYNNGKFVNHKKVWDKRTLFKHGESVILPLKDCQKVFDGLIDLLVKKGIKEKRPVFLAGHGVDGDLFYLNKTGFVYNQNLPILDTCSMWQHTSALPANVGAILGHLNIAESYLHNAANDAYATLRILLAICDPATRRKYRLDYGPSAAEADRLAQSEKNATDQDDPDSVIGTKVSPEPEATAAEKKKLIAQRRRERDLARLRAQQQDSPGHYQTDIKTAEDCMKAFAKRYSS